MVREEERKKVNISGKAGDRVIVVKGGLRGTGQVDTLLIGPKTQTPVAVKRKASGVTVQAGQQWLRYHKKAPFTQDVVKVKSGHDVVFWASSAAQKAQVAQYLRQEQVDVDNALATLKRLHKNNGKLCDE